MADFLLLCLEIYGGHLVFKKRKKGRKIKKIKGEIPRHIVDDRDLGKRQISPVLLSFWDNV